MAIDREALVKIRIALTGGEAGTAIEKIVTRMEALEKRLGLIGSGSNTSSVPQAFQQPGQATPTVIHISPIPLPTRITNFADMRSQAPSGSSYEKVQSEPRYQALSPTAAAAAQQQPWPGSTALSPTPPPAPAAPPWAAPAVGGSGSAAQTSPLPVTVTNFPSSGAGAGGGGGGFFSQLRTMLGSVLHMQHGGVVPGYGRGDVVPAMLEPGEGVLSNAMMRHMAGGGVHRSKNAKFHAFVSKFFGDKENDQGDGPGKTMASAFGRDISFDLKDNNAISTAFEMADARKGGYSYSEKSLALGSMDFAKLMKRFALAAGKEGFGIQYSAVNEKRRDLYEKVLEKLGFEQTGQSTWMPGKHMDDGGSLDHFDKGGKVKKKYREMLETVYDEEGEFTGKIGRAGLPAFMERVEKRLGMLRFAHDQPAAAVPHSSLDIPRTLMPQIAKENLGDFMAHLQGQGIGSEMGTTRVGDLKPSQNEIGLEKIAKNYLKSKKKLGQKVLITSSDGYIVDGHHGWAGMMMRDDDMEAQTMQINLPFKELLAKARAYDKVGYKGVGQNEISYDDPQGHFAGRHMAGGGTLGSAWNMLKGAGGIAANIWNDKGGIENRISESVSGMSNRVGKMAMSGTQKMIDWGERKFGKRVGGAAQHVGGKWNQFMDWIDRGPTYDGLEDKIGKGIGEIAWHGKDMFGDMLQRFNPFGKHLAHGGRQDMTQGGTMPAMPGVARGTDWHAAWLTDDEHVIRAGPARKHRRLLEAINADHGASGGQVGPDGIGHYVLGGVAAAAAAKAQRDKEGEEDEVKKAYKRMYGQPKQDPEHVAVGIAYGASRVAGAAGGGAAGGLISAGGDVGAAVVAGGPAGIAVAGAIAAIEVFKVSMDKTTNVMNILGDSTTSTAQKNRALAEEFIPFAKKFHDLSDAIDGTTGRINKSNQELTLALGAQKANLTRYLGTAALEQRQNEQRSAASGMSSRAISSASTFDHSSTHGRLLAHEEDVRLGAEDEYINAQRRLAGANQLLQTQRGRVGGASSAQRLSYNQAASASEASRQALATENSTGVRNRAGRTEADNRALQATGNARAHSERLRAEQNELQRVSLEQTNRQNEAEKARIGILQGQLALMKERSDRMQSDAQRVGGMSRGSREQGRIAFQLVRQHAQAGRDIADLPEGFVDQAAGFDPRQIATWREQSGNRYMQQNAAQMGETSQRDWAGGASVGDTGRQERALAQDVRRQLDQVAISSAHAIAQQFSDIMREMVRLLTDQMRITRMEMQTQIRAANNNRV